MLTHIPYDDASELSFGCSTDDYEFVHDENEGKGRWEIYHTIVFRYDDQFYGFSYAEPATEYQEGGERFEGDPVPVFSMIARDVTTTVYERV